VDDAERQALLEADGERVLRVTWDQVIARPGQTLSRIRAAGAPAPPTHRPGSNMLRAKPIVPGALAR
jgi:very-short-patch-repair endonuclease